MAGCIAADPSIAALGCCPVLTLDEARDILRDTRVALSMTWTARDREAIRRGLASNGADGRRGPLPVYDSCGGAR